MQVKNVFAELEARIRTYKKCSVIANISVAPSSVLVLLV